MHWYILGAGAIGRLWACLFDQGSVGSTLLLRNTAALARWQLSNRIEWHESDLIRHCTPDVETPDSKGPIRHLLVTTKAYDTLTALQAIQPRLLPGCEIVLLQNGMGQQQAALELLPECNIWAATTTAGAWCEPPDRLHCISRGETLIGPLSASTPALPSGWSRLPISLSDCTDIVPVLWRKLAINCAINPLTAIEHCRNGALLDSPRRMALLQEVCHEVEQVAKAAGMTLFEIPLLQQVEAVAHATGDNLSSMLQDIRHGRQTEIEQITGFLCRQAHEFGIETPYNSALLQQVRALTMARESQDD